MLLCQRLYVDAANVVDNLPFDNESISWIDEDTTAEEGKQYTICNYKLKQIFLPSELNALSNSKTPHTSVFEV